MAAGYAALCPTVPVAVVSKLSPPRSHSGAAEGGGPLMGTSSIEFGDKHVVDARGGDVPRPEINGVAEVAGDMDVAGTIHRHPIGGIAAGAAQRGRPIVTARSVGVRRAWCCSENEGRRRVGKIGFDSIQFRPCD